MGAVAAQQQLAAAMDPVSKQQAVNTLLQAQSQVVASANAAASAAVSQTQNPNQFRSSPIPIPHLGLPGHQSPRSGASSPVQGVDFNPHPYPLSPLPGAGTPIPIPIPMPGYLGNGVNPMAHNVSPVHSPRHQRGGHKSASAFYQQRGSYSSQNAAPPNLKRQGSGLVSASEVIEQISSGGQPTQEQQAAMGGGETYAPSRGGRISPVPTPHRGQQLNSGAQIFEPFLQRPDSAGSGGSREGLREGLGRGKLMRSGSSRSIYERSSSDEGQKEDRGFKGLGKKARNMKRSSSQSSMKRWDGGLVLADGPVNPDALQVG
jgi:hypothetical protein